MKRFRVLTAALCAAVLLCGLSVPVFFRLRGGVPAEHEGLTDAAALAGELEEPPVVHDAVDDRCGEFVVREDRAPFTELDVRGE